MREGKTASSRERKIVARRSEGGNGRSEGRGKKWISGKGSDIYIHIYTQVIRVYVGDSGAGR